MHVLPSQMVVYLLVRLSFISGTAAIMVGNQQEFLRGCRVDVVPLLNGIAKGGFGLERQRHGPFVPAAVDGAGEAFETFHHNHL